MKGYCGCGKEIDEVEFTQFGMCFECCTKKTYWEAYKQGYKDALDDYREVDNEGEHYNMNEDRD